MRGRGLCAGVQSPGSETYLTASDDSSSLFDDDMQRTDRPRFSLAGSSEGGLGDREEVRGAKLEDCSSEELNKRFQSQRLDSSSSSSEANTPSPSLTPKRPTPPQDPRDTPASPKQPRLRTPAGFGVMSVALAKRHLSQPPVSTEAAHGRTRNAISMLRPLRPQETDLDQEAGMELGKEMPQQPATLPTSPASPTTDTDEPLESPDSPSTLPGSKPPTPPLHRFPSWVSTARAPLWKLTCIAVIYSSHIQSLDMISYKCPAPLGEQDIRRGQVWNQTVRDLKHRPCKQR